MPKSSLRELMEFYRDHVQQVNKDWYLAASRRSDQIGMSNLDEVRILAMEDIAKLHPEYHKLSDELWSYIPTLQELTEGAPRDIARALEFCEIDVLGFRFGYVKASLYQEIKRLDLSNKEKRRINQLGLSYISWPGQRREMRELARLLIVTADEEFVRRLLALVESGANEDERRKAQIILSKVLNSRSCAKL